MLTPDLVVTRGRIFCGKGDRAAAEAMAVSRGRIVAVGDSDEIEQLRGLSTRHIDLEGALVLPGLSDSHTHFLEGALSYGIDLSDVDSKEMFRTRVKEALAGLPPGEWLVGGYWNEEKWGGTLPDKRWLDDISGDNPVLLYRQDIHSALCNSAALAHAGITAESRAPEGGEIVKGADGRPTGMLLESAVTPVKQSVPEPSMERIRFSLRRWMQKANSVGLTHIGDMIRGPEEFGLYLDLEREGFLTCRFELMPPIAMWERFARAGLRSGVGLELVKLGGMKVFIDGSLGSRTARMLQPYDDDPENLGRFSPAAESPSTLAAMLQCADRAGFRLAVHAIGDAANRLALDLMEKVRKDSPYPLLRHRIEHAQHPDPADIRRFGELRLVASVQPLHLVGDGCYAEKRIGRERSRNAFPLRSLADAGAVLVFGSDWPVVELDPLLAIEAAVTRRTADGRNPNGWIPGEKLTVEESVSASCGNSAFAAGQETRWGRLAPGLDADFVVLDRDIFSCDPGDIGSTRVRMTFLRGRQVYPEEEK